MKGSSCLYTGRQEGSIQTFLDWIELEYIGIYTLFGKLVIHEFLVGLRLYGHQISENLVDQYVPSHQFWPTANFNQVNIHNKSMDVSCL